ncbi:MAG: DEAD/DEAH box helicase family protein [Candidatus Cloacimonetes bacterium]|nr:DEAD/DEAH box helicase family protein [Candidatus Cloacimonadota bacterium]MDY0367272.1 DEAD/DEAH box helicase family protein [Candidatus Syntrophosphaera sp.]
MNESEWHTRKERIDTQLRSLYPAWEVIHFSQVRDTSLLTNHAVEEYPTQNGFADYALFVKGKLLGIIEAKRVSIDAHNALEQAKRYSLGCANTIGEWNAFRVPFIYSSNGVRSWFADIRGAAYSAREISGFHSPEALWDIFNQSMGESYNWFQLNPIEFEKIRPYQSEAIQAIENNICAGKRMLMLAMATGTGKTFTAVAMIYRLLKSGLARRVLFLVDRRALAAQAAVAFHSFETPSRYKFSQEYEVFSQRFQSEDFEDGDKFDVRVLPNSHLTKPDPAKSFVYICTIQRMAMNLFGRENAFIQGDDPDIDDEAARLDIANNAFDVIIADECHRGYTPKDEGIWRATINHFDAIKIGLTATPAAHTTAIFGQPVYRYSYEQAVLDGFLVDYEAVKINSNVRINGIFLEEGEKIGLKDTETGQERIDALEDVREFDASEIEQNITSLDSNRKILTEIFSYALEHEQRTGRFPKTLIFAVNDIQHKSHSDQLVHTAREILDRGDDFVQKITGNPNVDKPLEKIRRFRNRPEPAVVVTVDMLSTGVDIPALEYIVFLRPVKSRILWTQMLGRGTRKCTEINKECFTIFDCFDGTLIQYFQKSTDFTIDIGEEGQTISIREIIENIWNNIEPEYNKNRLIKRLRRISKTMSAKARLAFEVYIPDGDVKGFADNLKAMLKDDFPGTMRTLRDPKFQDLLVNYDRARKPFYIDYAERDSVSSEYMFRIGDEQLRPEDYLDAFAEFVKQNKNRIEALSILLNNPWQWNFDALAELRNELKKNSFDEDKVQKAHERSGHKAMADIISMIHNAEDEVYPLFTARERVEKVIGEMIQTHAFNSDQLQWLGFISEHLIKNLTLDKHALTFVPIFEMHGGLSRARTVFGPLLDEIISEINLRITA